MKKTQQGFTLIELMIVVAIVGILAAVALPAYQDYAKRAHVAEGLGLAEAAKTAVSEYWIDKGTWPTDNSAAGLETGTKITGNAVKSVTVDGGVITITYNEKVVSDGILKLAPNKSDTDGSIKWVCYVDNDPKSIPAKFLPAACRGTTDPNAG
ncbi:MAG: pilin [Betaproteobacteria bacterium]|nr:pilin [Betaproteobacteria bacterium]